MPEPEPATISPSVVSVEEGTPSVSLKSIAVRGAIWTIAGFGGSQVLRLLFNLIVARLLVPEYFGLMALVWTIVTGINLFSDLGIGPAVIRDPNGDEPHFLNTAWTLQIIRGFGLALFCFVLAFPVAVLYDDHRLRWILPLIGLSSIAAGFNSTSLLTLQRHMAVPRLVVMDLGIQIISGIAMVAWAWLRPSIWALIAGSVTPSLLRLVWSHCLMRERRDRIAWEQAAVRELLMFGRWVWFASMLTFLASQIDRLILGKLFTFQMLGMYSIATMFSEAPRSLAVAIVHNVIFPAYSKSSELPRAELRLKIRRYRWPLLVLMAASVAALVAVGDLVIRLLYDKRYAAGAWMLPVLALGIWPSSLAQTTESSLYAIGKPRYSASGNLLKLLFTGIGIPIGFSLAGPAGAVVVVALNDIPYYGRISYGLWREGLDNFGQDLKATALLAAFLALALGLRFILGAGLPIHP